jgi:multiple sugar transport system substrate-binding protein
MKTKLWSSLAVLLIASLVLAGCGAGKPTEATGPTKVTIFVGFGAGSDPDSMAALNALAEEYNSSHPDTQIEFTFSTWEEHASKFSTLLAGDLAPDLAFPIGVQGLAEFNDEWVDISPYIKKDNYDTSDYYGPAVELNSFPDRTIGLPVGVYPSVLFYNEDLFDKAGIAYPPSAYGDSTWTYDKVAETARALTLDVNGNTPDSPDFDPTQIDQWGWGGWCGPFRTVPAKFGSSPLGMDAGYKTASMNSGGYLEGFKFIADNIWKSHIQPSGEELTASFGGADNPFEGGNVAMWECFSWMAYAFPTFQNFNWNVAPVPAGPQGDLVSPTNADTFAISKHSKHPEQAWEVAKWLMAPEQLGRLCNIFGCIPARKSLAGGWLQGMADQYPQVDFQLFLDSIQKMDASPNNESWVPNYQKVWDATEGALNKIVSGDDKDAQSVADALNAEVQGYLDEYWAAQK